MTNLISELMTDSVFFNLIFTIYFLFVLMPKNTLTKVDLLVKICYYLQNIENYELKKDLIFIIFSS